MKLAILISALALASGIPLESQALAFAGGPGTGMHTAATMTGFAAGMGASAVHAGAGDNAGSNVSAAGNSAAASVMTVGGGVGNLNIDIPNINIPGFPGFILPEIIFPDIFISSFPKITIPTSASATGNEILQSGSGNVASQVNNHSTSVVQQGNRSGTGTVIIHNQDQNQVKQNSVP